MWFESKYSTLTKSYKFDSFLNFWSCYRKDEVVFERRKEELQCDS